MTAFAPPPCGPGRAPLEPRVGVLLLGDARDGLLLRWAQHLPADQPLAVAFEVLKDGSSVQSIDFRLMPLVEALWGRDELPDGLGTFDPRAAGLTDHGVREALGLLLLASDRSFGRRGVTPRFAMATPSSPCPICGAVAAHPGVSRGCVMSAAGVVICRDPSGRSGLGQVGRRIASVVGCKCRGELWVVAEPAASRLVLPEGESW